MDYRFFRGDPSRVLRADEAQEGAPLSQVLAERRFARVVVWSDGAGLLALPPSERAAAIEALAGAVWIHPQPPALWSPFVRAALKQLAVENPKARALMAETQTRYFVLMLVGILAMGALALALLALPTPETMASWAPLAKFAVVLALLPVFWAGILRVIPRGVPLDEIPPRALPPENPGTTES